VPNSALPRNPKAKYSPSTSDLVLALPYHMMWDSTKRGEETLPMKRTLLHFVLVAPMPLQNPTNPTITGVFSISKVFVVVGF
jgi:hypothetical protein